MPQHDSYTPPFEDCETLSRTLHVDLSRLHDVEIGMTDEGTAFLKLFVHNTDRAVKLVGLTVGKDACFTFSLGTDEVGNVHSCRRLAPRYAFSPDRLGCRLTMHGLCTGRREAQVVPTESSSAQSVRQEARARLWCVSMVRHARRASTNSSPYASCLSFAATAVITQSKKRVSVQQQDTLSAPTDEAATAPAGLTLSQLLEVRMRHCIRTQDTKLREVVQFSAPLSAL